ncbi:antigen 5 like allergen Cul n 1-like [Lucilia sericata]|uniref:antigen 5 like allergen Cul n 1-like n=1 Tax=Lucilia sericata TaxID=13632 RepID=UPI0018A82BF1|nr:antigen 5 like allergen Cul n 1-like [Lucilia sericata]
MNNFAILMCVVAAIAFASGTDYCSDSLCSAGVTHIACGNSGNFADTCPDDAALVNIDDNLKNVIVSTHNEKRNFIAGGGESKLSPACRMATMEWDDELAAIAAFNVKQCAMAHDKCRNSDTFHYSGQNLAWMGFFGQANDASMLQQAVNMWYGEVADSKMEYINSYPNNYNGPTIGHFTVMVADRNIRVGCAASTYSVTDQPYKAYLVACNYATTNMINFPIYTSCDKAASSCTTGVNEDYPNLCSSSEVYEVNKWF